MKPSVVIPLFASLLGFGLGWMLKPPAKPAASPTITTEPSRPTNTNSSPAAIPQSTNPAAPTPPDYARKPAPGASLAEAAERKEKLSHAITSAKMFRLAEAVGLSVTQQAELQKIIKENAKAMVSEETEIVPGPQETLDVLVRAGNALEKSLASLLTSEQAAAFAELRKRESENRIEATAQRDLGSLTEITDLSPEQRENVLAYLRKTTADEFNSIPAPLTLILDSSVLPLGSQAVSEQAIQTLRQVADTQHITDPMALHAKIIDNARRTTEGRLDHLKAILTPAQLVQYQATIAGQNAIQDLMVPPQP
jgi:hypothetical protein